MNFCMQFHIPSLPLSEETLCRFVVFLSVKNLTYQTIRLYLSAVRHLQIINGLPDPSLSSLPRLGYVLWGIRRTGITRQPRHNRLPITPELLRAIYQVWSAHPPDFNKVMLWAAFLLGFFGFFRSGEFTCPSSEAFIQGVHLSPGDLAVDSHTSPSYLAVHLNQSKTDPFGSGLNVYLGKTEGALCPVTAALAYLAIRPATPGPLFIFQDGSSLSRHHLSQGPYRALETAGFDASGYSGHSFRIGAATAAAKAGLPDSLIKTLGRWQSSSYTLYIRTPKEQLVSASRVLTSV